MTDSDNDDRELLKEYAKKRRKQNRNVAVIAAVIAEL